MRHAAARREGAPLTTVPYKGTAPAMTDMLGRQLDLMCDQTTNTRARSGGKVKPYAVTTEERWRRCRPADPARAGCPGFEMSVWHGLWAPKGTPRRR